MPTARWRGMAMGPAPSLPPPSLFRRYLAVLFVAVIVPLIVTSATNAWFRYTDQRMLVGALLRAEAFGGATRIHGFFDGIRSALGWTLQRPWTGSGEDQHELDALRALRQAPAIADIALLDAGGIERLAVSRIALNRTGGAIDRSADPALLAARRSGVWYGSVRYRDGSEPYLPMAVAGGRRGLGFAKAEVNLKLIRDVVAAIRVGSTGHAYVLDAEGRLVAHPDLSRVLRGAEPPAVGQGRRLRARLLAAEGGAVALTDADGAPALAAMAPIEGLGWILVVEQPLAEAFAPVRLALWRAGLLLIGSTLAVAALAFGLARRMTRPIRLLEEGARRIGAGHFDHRIRIASGDELERLAEAFNHMAAELALSKERSERIGRLRRFLAPQVAELVENAGGGTLLAAQQAEVVTLFCDLRGFTAFAGGAGPDEIMGVLNSYYGALGPIITEHGATLTSFQGDGLMVLLNAPLPRPESALQAIAMATQMQERVQQLASGWRRGGHTLGFGIGIAAGPATVGLIGYEGRADYTAIGDVVNRAARLCAAAADGQILVDDTVAAAVRDRAEVTPVGTRTVKGYGEPLTVHGVDWLRTSSSSVPPRAAPVPPGPGRRP